MSQHLTPQQKTQSAPSPNHTSKMFPQVSVTRISLADRIAPRGGQRSAGLCLAYFSILMENIFAVHSIRLIQRKDGTTTIAFPSEERRDYCPNPECQARNYYHQDYCGSCGEELPEYSRRVSGLPVYNGRPSLHCDLAHPIENTFRRHIEKLCLEAYKEARRTQQQEEQEESEEQDLDREADERSEDASVPA